MTALRFRIALSHSALDLHRGGEAAPRCVSHNKMKGSLIRLAVCEGSEREEGEESPGEIGGHGSWVMELEKGFRRPAWRGAAGGRGRDG